MKHDVACELAAKTQASRGGDLSHDVLVKAAHRLGSMALAVGLLGLTLAVVTGTLRQLTDWQPPTEGAHTLAVGAKVVLMLASLGLWSISRRLASAKPRLVLDLGLVYQGLGAVLISVPSFWGDHLISNAPGQVGWLGVWIVLFPLIVPAPPPRLLITALLCASLPLSIHFCWTLQSGSAWPTASAAVSTFSPYFFCAGLAFVPALLTWRMNKSICEAESRAKKLGSYALQERLGAGGMGEVWRAEHRMLARPAAIKLIKPDFLAGSDADRATLLARFEREARATAALDSPHTVELYDFGVTDEGTFYYVMEMLRGVDMETLVAKHGAVSPARAVYLLRQACASLAEAHAAGMVHRDIKPANLYVCRLGLELDYVKVLDFGLVRRTQTAGQPGTAHLTGAGYIVGTPAYMAPEQAESGNDVGSPADIYSLGCVAYWLLTGKGVFQHDSPMRVLVDHIKTPPERPSVHLPEALPAELEALVMACLAKNPLERPASAQALAEQLDALPLAAWTQADARGWWREHLPDVLEGDATSPSASFDVYASTVSFPAPTAG